MSPRSGRDELVISRGALVLVVSAMIAGTLLLIGHVATPRVAGRPVLLSRGNWRLTCYLNSSQSWLRILMREHHDLLTMLPPIPAAPDDEIGMPMAPVDAPTVYERSRLLQQSLSSLTQLRAAMERTEVPSALKPLHELAVASSNELLALQHAVTTALGSPSRGAVEEATSRAQSAGDHLSALQRALEAQLGLLRSESAPAMPLPSPTAASYPATPEDVGGPLP